MEKGIFEALKKEKEKESTESFAKIVERARTRKKEESTKESAVRVKRKPKISENVVRLREAMTPIQRMFVKKYQG